jgi:hypothetical protein
MIVIAVLALLLLVRRSNLSNSARRSAAAAAVDDYRRARDKADLGTLCPGCGSLAEPLGDTRNRYGCLACELRFSGQPHEWKGA